MLLANSNVQHRGGGGASVADHPRGAPLHPSKDIDRSFLHSKRGERWWRTTCAPGFLRRCTRRRSRWLFSLLTAAVLFALLLLFTVSFGIGRAQRSGAELRELQSLQRSLFLEEEVNPAALQPRFLCDGGVCAVCAEGHVLFRAAEGNAVTDSGATSTVDDGRISDTFTVCAESVEERTIRMTASRSPTSQQRRHRFLNTAHDCVARLHDLGLLRPPRAIETVHHNASCTQLRVAVHVLADGVSMPPVRCSAVVAQLQRSHNDSSPLVELSTPRLTVWPMHYPASSLLSDNEGDGTVPLYFGTAAVSDTDVDHDVPPPLAIALTDTSDAIRVRFDSSSISPDASARPSPDLRCPLHFLTVRLGRFGRHHNQLQEVLNGVSLAARLNRTFILPPFVPALYTSFLKLDTEILYGWHTLREVGRYCVFTYTEARPILRQVYTDAKNTSIAASMTAAMTMARVHFTMEAIAQAQLKQMPEKEKEWRLWGHLPRLPHNTTIDTLAASPLSFYDAEEWFACGVRHTQNSHALLQRSDTSRLLFREDRSPFTEANLRLGGGVGGSCWEDYLTGVQALVKRYGGGSRGSVEGRYASNQPDLVVLSSTTAFHVRPRLTEMTRLLGLLRPSPSITSEVGRFYRLWATQYRWPPYTSVPRTFNDCLQPRRLRGVVGLHVRRRELTCRHEAEHLSQTIIPLSEGRYVLDGAGQGTTADEPAPANSTVGRLANDCVWDARSLVHLFHQYTQWMTSERQQRLHHGSATATLVNNDTATTPRYTSYVAYDEQAGPIGQELEVALQRQYRPTAKELLADGTRPSFTAIYDRRSRVDFREAYQRVRQRVTTPPADPRNATAVEEAATWTMDRLTELLYPVAELELMGMAFDFFMLSNTEVFRGNVISSVSINVCVRRWGRGLPCHGVMPGYYEVLYKGFP